MTARGVRIQPSRRGQNSDAVDSRFVSEAADASSRYPSRYVLVLCGTPAVASSMPAIAARSASGMSKASAISRTRTGCGLCHPVRAALMVDIARAVLMASSFTETPRLSTPAWRVAAAFTELARAI